MLIKLRKKAQWEGVQHKAGSIHDIDASIANKLILRGYAEKHIPMEIVDATSAE